MLVMGSLQHTKEQGLSLVELMVGLAIGLLLTTGILNFYITSMKANTDNLQMSMLNQELRSMLHIIDRDVRRAGFWAGVPGTDDLSANPFMSNPNDLLISEKTGEPADSCVIYSFDLDKDKRVDVGNAATSAPFNAPPYDLGNVEQFGFRLNGNAVEMRTGLATASETTLDCDSGAWSVVTDNHTEITQFNFSLNTQYLNVTTGNACSPVTTNCCASSESCQLIRDVNINISGRLVKDSSVVKTVAALIRVRNDKYIVMP